MNDVVVVVVAVVISYFDSAIKFYRTEIYRIEVYAYFTKAMDEVLQRFV